MLVVSLSPDIQGENFGHYQPFEDTLRKACIRRELRSIHVVGMRGRKSLTQIPWFSNSRNVFPVNAPAFGAELTRLVESLQRERKDEALFFFLYSGDLRRFKAMHEVANNYPDCIFMMNFLWDQDSVLERSIYPLPTNMRISVESGRLAARARAIAGKDAAIHLPLFPPQIELSKNQKSPNSQNRVTFFTSADPSRGPEITKKVLQLILKDFDDGLRPSLRVGFSRFNDHGNWMPSQGQRLDQFEGQLSKRAWMSLIGETLIGVIPYSPAQWKFKSSGVFVELLSQERIPVVLRGTWMAEELTELGLNSLISAPTPQDLRQTVLRAIQDRDRLARNLRELSSKIRTRYSADRFVESLVSIGEKSSERIFDG
jgi:hypothetical protein